MLYALLRVFILIATEADAEMGQDMVNYYDEDHLVSTYKSNKNHRLGQNIHITMPSDKVKLFGKLLILLVPLAFKILYQGHSWSYKQASTVKNVIVLGASFTGVQLTTNLSKSLPTGYRVVMIEKNSHFN